MNALAVTRFKQFVQKYVQNSILFSFGYQEKALVKQD